MQIFHQQVRLHIKCSFRPSGNSPQGPCNTQPPHAASIYSQYWFQLYFCYIKLNILPFISTGHHTNICFKTVSLRKKHPESSFCGCSCPHFALVTLSPPPSLHYEHPMNATSYKNMGREQKTILTCPYIICIWIPSLCVVSRNSFAAHVSEWLLEPHNRPNPRLENRQGGWDRWVARVSLISARCWCEQNRHRQAFMALIGLSVRSKLLTKCLWFM